MQNTIPERCAFKEGDVINGEYRVEKLLGEGSFGIVYKVADHSGKVFALKILPLWKKESGDREELVKRFQMEFDTGRIKSDYLVYSYFYDWVNGNPYILMDFCPNGDLTGIAQGKKADYEKIACHILYGLGALHRNGKVHRDLKPANVLAKKDDTFVLSDFGTSGDLDKQVSRWNFFKKAESFGTFAYMSPEQMRPKKSASTCLPTTDIFSFGVLIYELMFKKYPFGELENKNDLEGYTQNAQNGNWNQNVFKDHPELGFWKEIMDGCLQPDFKKRFQSVDEILSIIPYHQKNKQSARHLEEFDIKRDTSKGFSLKILHGEEHDKVFNLNDFIKKEKYIVTMGRLNETCTNDIDLKDGYNSFMSRRHCTLEYDPVSKQWFVRDGQWYDGSWNHSMNGTYVNSTELHETEDGIALRAGDILSLGDIKLRVEGV